MAKSVITIAKPDGSTMSDFIAMILAEDLIMPDWIKQNIMSFLYILPGKITGDFAHPIAITFNMEFGFHVENQEFKTVFNMAYQKHSSTIPPYYTFSAWFDLIERINYPHPVVDLNTGKTGEHVRVHVNLGGMIYDCHPGFEYIADRFNNALTSLVGKFNRAQSTIKARNTKTLKAQNESAKLINVMTNMGIHNSEENLNKIFDICDDKTVPLQSRRQLVVDTIADMIKNLKK